jgi:hypothetical protein
VPARRGRYDAAGRSADVSRLVVLNPQGCRLRVTGRRNAAPNEEVPMFEREKIQVVVLGGEANGYWPIMGANYGKNVCVDEWR